MTMHYGHQDILDAAEDIGDGWRKAVITLTGEDTVYSGLSGKWDFRGPGTVTYMMSPAGWHVTPSESVSKRYK